MSATDAITGIRDALHAAGGEPLAKLVMQLIMLHELPPIERAARAAKLPIEAQTALAGVRKLAIRQALETGQTRKQIAAALGITEQAISKILNRE